MRIDVVLRDDDGSPVQLGTIETTLTKAQAEAKIEDAWTKFLEDEEEDAVGNPDHFIDFLTEEYPDLKEIEPNETVFVEW